MKILLVNPPMSGYQKRELFASEPLGLAYLASYLRQRSFDVQVLDCYAKGIDQIYSTGGFLRRGLTDSQIKELLLRINPDIIGIHSNFSSYFSNAEEVARVAREAFPQKHIVFGGAHATMESRSIVESRIGDFVVRGEGEITAAELFGAIYNNLPVDGILGITYRDPSGVVRVTPDRPLLDDIESIPVPARDKLDMGVYLKHSRHSSPFSMNHPAASLITSRGCPHDCVFCSTKNMWRRRWRANSPQNVIKEIEGLVNDYGVKEIIIQDDNFIIDKKRAEEILDLLIEKKLGITLHNSSGFPAGEIDRSFLRKMKRAGFYRIILPVESGNPGTLKFIKKSIDLDKVPGIVKEANRIGLWTQTNFIIGFPYESRQDILDTIYYAFKSGFDFASFLIAQPFAGSDMRAIFKKEGYLAKGSSCRPSTFFQTGFDTKHLRAEELQDFRDRASTRYIRKRLLALLNPRYFIRYFWPKINSANKFNYFMRITCVNLNYIFNNYKY